MEQFVKYIPQLLEICIIPLCGILTKFVVDWIKDKCEELKANKDSVLYKKYIDMLENTVTSCVIATNQTYVDTLKHQGKFTSEAQETAFELTLSAVLDILSKEAKVYLENVFIDFKTFLNNKIEEAVAANKKG